jgi:MFS family permease
MKVTTNSWECLLVEDAVKSQITGIYSLVVVCGQLSALFAPVSSILVSRLTLIPAIRILYLNAFVLMTVKILLLYAFSRETGRGVIRMRETHGKSVVSLAAGYGGVLKLIGKDRGTIFALVINILAGIVGMINTTFWQVIVNKKLLVPEPLLPLFSAFKSVVAIIFLFLIAPRLKRLKPALVSGFAFYFAGQLLLILTPAEGLKYVMLCVSLVFDGFGFASLIMLAGSLVALYANAEERARVMAILHMIIMACSSPFGWIGGLLSDVSRILPFVLNLFLMAIGLFVTMVFYHRDPGQIPGTEPAV